LCGLVGIAGKIGLKEEKAFELLLMLDTIRGPHSTGVLLVNGSKACKVVKEIGTAWDFLASREYDVACAGYHNVLMGHNRWATRGKINARNAHPFEFPNIIGAHNGTLTTTYQLDDHYKFEVDSENIFHHMNKNGVEDTISKLTERLPSLGTTRKSRRLTSSATISGASTTRTVRTRRLCSGHLSHGCCR